MGYEIRSGQKSYFGDRHRKSETNGHLAAIVRLRVKVFFEYLPICGDGTWLQLHVCI
jgi:hypothetical protein